VCRQARRRYLSPIRLRRARCALALLLLTALASGSAAAAPRESFASGLAARLAGDAPQVRIAGAVLWSTPFLREIYATPAALWTPARLAALRTEIARVADDGLDPSDYLVELLDAASSVTPVERELLASEALGRLAFTLHFGKANPAALDADYNYSRSFGQTDPAAWLKRAITSDELAETLAALRPQGVYYERLVAALAAYRQRAASGAWPTVPRGETLKPGMVDARVVALRARLAASPHSAPAESPADLPTRYDDALTDAVRAFQRRHGLLVDAAVGPRTLAALNEPIAARIDALRINLERLRWVFRDLSEAFVAVNIAAFRAVYVADGELRWHARAIVGRPYRQTPVFRDAITYLELNPTWTVPPTILRKDILPRLREDAAYLAAKHLRVIDPNGGPVDSTTIDWATVRASTFPYLLRQDPGPHNALGRIKFMFPNRHAVYLHDTPARDLFARAERVFSSGCIRIEKPLDLAIALLDEPARWDRAALEAAIGSGRTQRLRLPRPVPIMLLYLTAYADENGMINFRHDVYGRDAAVLAALDGPLRWAPPRTR